MLQFGIIIIISGIIGWGTNKIALLLLFRPYEKKQWLPVLSPGIIPRSKHRIAVSVAEFVTEELLGKASIHHFLAKRLEKRLAKILGDALHFAGKQMPLSVVIRESIENFAPEDVERMVNKVASEYFRHIEILGGIIGALIGVVQYVVIRTL